MRNLDRKRRVPLVPAVPTDANKGQTVPFFVAVTMTS
jgi:hypothetical protein